MITPNRDSTDTDLVKVKINSAGYAKDSIVIRDINLSVRSGELMGLIGPNGAGKSTVLKGIMGLLPTINGSVEFREAQKNYAYIPEQPILYEELTLWEHLEFAAAVNGISPRELEIRSEELLRLFRLEQVKHNLPVSFSKGMQQKVMLIMAFLLRPSLLIIDEPFIGLDPLGVRDLLALIQKARDEGSGVLMSTHSLDTAEKICTSFVLLNEGTILTQGNIEEIRKRSVLPHGSLFDCFINLVEKKS